VLDETKLLQEPLWQQEPVVTLGETVKLVVEVVSTNWQNDYARKFEDYENLQIQEYWIVDYLGLGGKHYIGIPKQPTVTVCRLANQRYEKRLLHGQTAIDSCILPELKLSITRLFDYGSTP